MSNMYDLLFSQNEQKDFLLNLLQLKTTDCGRFRDIYVTESHIVIHTRNNNREEFKGVFNKLSKHPLYVKDEDSQDNKYADIYFSHPKESEAVLKKMAKESMTPDEKWKKLIKSLK